MVNGVGTPATPQKQKGLGLNTPSAKTNIFFLWVDLSRFSPGPQPLCLLMPRNAMDHLGNAGADLGLGIGRVLNCLE